MKATAQLVAGGRCIRCETATADAPSVYCQHCSPKRRTRRKERPAATRETATERARRTGLCAYCGKRPLTGKTLCARCFVKSVGSNTFGTRLAGDQLVELLEKQQHRCPHTGKPLVLGRNTTLVRIDPLLPKTLSNVQWIWIDSGLE